MFAARETIGGCDRESSWPSTFTWLVSSDSENRNARGCWELRTATCAQLRMRVNPILLGTKSLLRRNGAMPISLWVKVGMEMMVWIPLVVARLILFEQWLWDIHRAHSYTTKSLRASVKAASSWDLPLVDRIGKKDPDTLTYGKASLHPPACFRSPLGNQSVVSTSWDILLQLGSCQKNRHVRLVC